jgi:hypothetical protein
MWGTRCRADKRIAGLQSAVSGIAISGIIELHTNSFFDEADMNS